MAKVKILSPDSDSPVYPYGMRVLVGLKGTNGEIYTDISPLVKALKINCEAGKEVTADLVLNNVELSEEIVAEINSVKIDKGEDDG